jgi:hypothetical protein
MKRHLHAAAGILAITLVVTFMVATILAEALGGQSIVVAVKTAILFALFGLIPSVMVAGGSGRSLAAGRKAPLFHRKRRRTVLVAATGILVLVPCAVVLRTLAAVGDFGTPFVVLQGAEIAGGLVNLTLLSLNARDGRRLTAATHRRASAPPAVRG